MIVHRRFWSDQPALLLGITLLLGTSTFLFWEGPWQWIFPSLWVLYLLSLHSWPMIPILFLSAVYSSLLYSGNPTGEKGYFSIHSLKPHKTPFQKNLLYQGSLYLDGHRVPCSVYHPEKGYPKANCDYILKGQLLRRGAHQYTFRAKEWFPVKRSWSLAELRYQTKENLRRFLESKIKKKRVSSFLSSLITGDIEDRTLRYEFSHLGLQHILAISGFHFAILITFCTFFLNFFLKFRWRIIALLLVINGYFFFIGALPAVQRSWLTAALYLTGKLIGRHSSGLNLLGVACSVELIIDPLISNDLGFQLSFLSSASILLLYSPMEQFLQNFLPKRSPSQLLELPPLHKILSLLSSFFRSSISITIAVNMAILPLLLYHFHRFPLLSFLYNLFFPFLVSIALSLLLTSLVLFVIFPPIGQILFKVTEIFTSEILHLSTYPPIAIDYSLQIASLPGWIIPLYLFGLFSVSQTNFLLKNQTMFFQK